MYNYSRGTKILLYSFLVAYSCVTLMPFIWSIFASLHPRSDIVEGNIVTNATWTLENYQYILFEMENFARWIFNSFFVAIVGTAMNVVLNTMAGYSLSRLHYPGRGMILNFILVVMIVPGQILLIPNYILMSNIGLLDTYTSLILPSAVNATYIFMMYQFFKNFPDEVEEAASMDGLSGWQTFWKISFPMAKPAIATMALFIFQGFWNSFQAPLLYISSVEMYTLPLGLQDFTMQYVNQWNLIMAGAIISIIPMIILYILLNKYFMEGAKIGSDK